MFNVDFDVDMVTETTEETGQTSSNAPPAQGRSVCTVPNLISQGRLQNMCRRLELSQRKSRLLATMLRENNLLLPNVAISSQINRHAELIPFFTTEENLTFCPNVAALMEKLIIENDIEDWRLFIDASTSGLEVVLLNNDKIYDHIIIPYSRVLKETHESMHLIFNKIQYLSPDGTYVAI